MKRLQRIATTMTTIIIRITTTSQETVWLASKLAKVRMAKMARLAGVAVITVIAVATTVAEVATEIRGHKIIKEIKDFNVTIAMNTAILHETVQQKNQ
jgi:hypothetical protein